jgi:hypothetical protein
MTEAAPLDGLSQRLDSMAEATADLLDLLHNRITELSDAAKDLLELLHHRTAGVTDAATEALHTIQGVSKLWGQPHRMYGATVSWDGQQWCAQLGDPESGVAGFGRTPEDACESFDEIWRGWPQARGPQVRGAN